MPSPGENTEYIHTLIGTQFQPTNIPKAFKKYGATWNANAVKFMMETIPLEDQALTKKATDELKKHFFNQLLGDNTGARLPDELREWPDPVTQYGGAGKVPTLKSIMEEDMENWTQPFDYSRMASQEAVATVGPWMGGRDYLSLCVNDVDREINKVTAQYKWHISDAGKRAWQGAGKGAWEGVGLGLNNELTRLNDYKNFIDPNNDRGVSSPHTGWFMQKVKILQMLFTRRHLLMILQKI